MTTIATMMAAVPPVLGIGPGTETRSPMAAAVLGGLTVSTILSLLVVPAFYVVTDRLKNLRRKRPAPSPRTPVHDVDVLEEDGEAISDAEAVPEAEGDASAAESDADAIAEDEGAELVEGGQSDEQPRLGAGKEPSRDPPTDAKKDATRPGPPDPPKKT
jgi:hypothetical protein